MDGAPIKSRNFS